jgi:hypothetical protein
VTRSINGKSQVCTQEFGLKSWIERPVKCRSLSYFSTNGQSFSLFLYETYCGTCDEILLLIGSLVTGSCGLFCESPSLAIGRVFILQCNHSKVRVAQDPWIYFNVSSKTSSTWRDCFPYLQAPGTGSPVILPVKTCENPKELLCKIQISVTSVAWVCELDCDHSNKPSYSVRGVYFPLSC